MRIVLLGVLLLSTISWSYLGSSQKALNILFKKRAETVWEYSNDGEKVFLKGYFEKDSAIILEWAKKNLFTEKELWEIFDKIHPGSDIYRIEKELFAPQEFKNYHTENGIKHWVVRSHQGVIALIELAFVESAYYVTARTIKTYRSQYRDLIPQYSGGLNQFIDYTNSGSDLCVLKNNELCHLTNNKNKAITVTLFSNNEILFEFNETIEKPIENIGNYKNWKKAEQKEFLSMTRAFLKHEYNIMIKSFIGTAPTLFNWQMWEWFDHMDTGFIGSQELDGYLRAGNHTEMVRVFQHQLKKGTLELFCSFNGKRTLSLKVTP